MLTENMDSGNGSKEIPSGNLCRNGCGFYGSAATEGMCSKCFKDYQRKKQNSPALATSNATTPTGIAGGLSSPIASSIPDLPVSTASTTTPSLTPTTSLNQSTDLETDGAAAAAVSTCKDLNSDKEPSPSPTTSNSSSDGGSEGEKGKKKRNRCHTCRKKVGLTGFVCRCGGLYCSIHRYSDKHECSFDYRTHGKEEIRKNNPVVVGEKIQKL